MTQRRQRVRRLALEDNGSESAAASSNSQPAATKRKRTTKAKKTAYASSALRRHQNKTTDLFPKRPLAITLMICALVAVVGLFNYLATLNPISAAGHSSALALNETGSLSSWFSSFLLILSGLASLQIYALRQHRNDDYRGSYRIWIWMAVIFLIASMNSVVDFGTLFSTVAGTFFDTATTSPQTVFWWLFAAKIVALTGLVVRGVFELRASKSALVMVALVWIAYATSLIIQIPQARNSIVSNYDTVYGNCLLIGTVSVFMMVVFYTRYVFLAANSMLNVKKKTAKKKKPAAAVKPKSTSKSPAKSTSKAKPEADEQNEAAPVRIAKATTKTASKTSKRAKPKPVVDEQPAPAKRSGLRSPLAAKMQSMQQDEEPSSEQSEILSLRDKKSLSKSERKRLKKLERRVDQRRAA